MRTLHDQDTDVLDEYPSHKMVPKNVERKEGETIAYYEHL